LLLSSAINKLRHSFKRCTTALGLLSCLCTLPAFAGEAASPAGADQLPNPLARQTMDHLSATLDRPLFVLSRRAAPPTIVPLAQIEEVPPPPPPPLPNLTLLGILKEGEDLHAVVRTSGNEQITRVRIGDLLGGWKVADIAGRRLLLSLDEQTTAFVLFETMEVKPTRSAAAANKRRMREQAVRNDE
jgi:general secretion pathway protein N